MKIPSGLNDPNVYSNYSSSQEPVVVVNNDKKEKKRKETNMKELKKTIPKRLRKSKYEPTEEQKLRIFKNYIQPQLTDNNTNDTNTDLVQSLKEAFGKDNKENLSKILPTFSYDNEAVRQKLSNELFNNNEDITPEPIRPKFRMTNSNDIESILKTIVTPKKLTPQKKKFTLTEGDAAIKIQRAFKEPIREGIAVARLENQIKNAETVVSKFKENLNEKRGVELRKIKGKTTTEISNIRKSARTNEEKQKLLEPRIKKVKDLTEVIIQKKRGKNSNI